MSRLKRITLQDFSKLIERAQQTHYVRDESIPRLNPSEIDTLESCLNTPFQQYSGTYFYRGFIAKAAVIFYLLIKNHPLSNGNKRMACLTLYTFCALNNFEFRMPVFLFEQMAKDVACSQPEMKDDIIKMISGRLKHYVIKKKH